MPFLPITCETCGSLFEKAERFHRRAEKSGVALRFCSKTCSYKARSEGRISGKPRNGAEAKCEICASDFYCSPAKLKKGRARFCSETCRLQGHAQRLIHKPGPQLYRRFGDTIKCCVCGDEAYRRKSLIRRNISKTCGKRACVSTYSRSLWGLPPRDKETIAKPRPQRKRRRTNFTDVQRRLWLGDRCVWCGTTSNLTLDHVMPVCAGGLSEQSNAQTLCGPCNNLKALKFDKKLARKQARTGGC